MIGGRIDIHPVKL